MPFLTAISAQPSYDKEKQQNSGLWADKLREIISFSNTTERLYNEQ